LGAALIDETFLVHMTPIHMRHANCWMTRLMWKLSIARRKTAVARLAGISLKPLIATAKVLETHQSLLDLAWDVTDGLLPLSLTPAYRADEDSHAVQRDGADLANPC
jgi:hypothetical protein